jgi:hypothetical protein
MIHKIFIGSNKKLSQLEKFTTFCAIQNTKQRKKIEIYVQLKMKTLELPTYHETQTTKKKTQKLRALQNLKCKKKTLKS